MSGLVVCLKLLVYFAVVSCLFINSASAQQKYFKITDEGKYYFFNEATLEHTKVANNGYTFMRLITPRTFYFEARKANLFPESLTISAFENMTLTEKQHLLDSLQPDFDWSKYQVSEEEENPVVHDIEKPDFSADTTYSVQNLYFDKESSTLTGEVVSGMGRKQPFMLYPDSRTSSGNVFWIIEWIEADLYMKKRGYRNLNLQEERIYHMLTMKGIDMNVLNGLIE